jgi:hypothetical protein
MSALAIVAAVGLVALVVGVIVLWRDTPFPDAANADANGQSDSKTKDKLVDFPV